MLRRLHTCADAISAVPLYAQDLLLNFDKPVEVAGYASGVAVEWKVNDHCQGNYFVMLRHNN